MPFTLRQRIGLHPALILWLLITALCAISGPFGTQEGLGLGARTLYWGAVVGGSVLGSLLIGRLDLQPLWQQIAAWTVFAVSISGAVILFGRAFFDGEDRTGGFLYLTAIVGATVIAVHLLLWLARRSMAPPERTPDTGLDASARFQRRLPLEARGPLVRIEAQDHYLNVVTQNGAALILMRLAEAVDALEPSAGLQVHRSHWVALDAVRAHKREGTRDLLEMSDGTQVPVARTRRKAAQEAGLF